MDLDVEAVGAWVGRWGVEAALGLAALIGVAVGGRRGDPVVIVVAVALAAAVVDRVRLRMDNRSLALAVREVRDERVSAVRREAGAVGTEAGGHAGLGSADDSGTDAGREAVDGGDGEPSGAVRSATDEE